MSAHPGNRRFQQEMKCHVFRERKSRGASTSKGILAAIIGIVATVGFFVIPIFTSSVYVAHNLSCSISGHSTTAQPVAECKGVPVQPRAAPAGVTLPSNAIFWTFRVTRSTTFTLDFHANESLIVVLMDLTSGGLIVQFDQSNLGSSMYDLGPGNYSLSVANQNNMTVGFTFDAYGNHGTISPN